MEQLFTYKIKIVSKYIGFMALMFVFWLHQDYFSDNFVAQITSLIKSLYSVLYAETILVAMERRKKI